MSEICKNTYEFFIIFLRFFRKFSTIWTLLAPAQPNSDPIMADRIILQIILTYKKGIRSIFQNFLPIRNAIQIIFNRSLLLFSNHFTCETNWRQYHCHSKWRQVQPLEYINYESQLLILRELI